MGDSRRRWSPEFKRDAVALVRSSGRPISAGARELGCGESSLGYWLANDRPAHEHHPRMAHLMPPRGWDGPEAVAAVNLGSSARKVMFVGPRLTLAEAVRTTMNAPAFWRAEIPAVALAASARSLATPYGTLAFDAADDQWRLCSAATIAAHTVERYHGPDVLLGDQLRLGLGCQLPTADAPFSPSANAFGHAGLSGALGFADPTAGIGFDYVPNMMGGASTIDRRSAAIIDAVYSCL